MMYNPDMSLDLEKIKIFVRRHCQQRIVINTLKFAVADAMQQMLDDGIITDAELEDEELRAWLGDLNLRDILY